MRSTTLRPERRLSGRTVNLTGHRYGRWTVLAFTKTLTKRNNCRWLCRCDCGTERIVSSKVLRGGESKSCGCLHREIVTNGTKHGESRNEQPSPEYRALKQLIQRCTNPNNPSWKDYGGRGIKIHESWIHGEQGKHALECFLAAVGRRPSAKHSLDRYPNNDGNYEPGNVRWATRKEQNNNRRKHGRIETFSDEELIAELQRRAKG